VIAGAGAAAAGPLAPMTPLAPAVSAAIAAMSLLCADIVFLSPEVLSPGGYPVETMRSSAVAALVPDG
jgi:hypothetical protein